MIEAYRIGISLALTNQVSSILGLIARDFAKTDAGAVRLKKTLSEIKLLGLTGAALGGAGFIMLSALRAPLKAASEYENALTRFKSLNLGDAANKDADQFARAAKLYGVSATDLISTVRDLHTVFGDYDKAKALAPMIAQMEFANQAVFGEKGNRFDDAQRKALGKVLELRKGFESPEAMSRMADMMQHVMSGTGGMVKPSDYLLFMKSAGTASRLLSDHAFFYGMEPIIQEMGGFRTGTGLQTAFNRVVLGIGSGGGAGKAFAELMTKTGLWQKGGVEINPTTGQVTKVAGHMKDADKTSFEEDPQKFLLQRIVPALKAVGYDTDQKLLEAFALIFGRTGGALFSLMYLQRDKIEKNVRVDEQAMGIAELMKAAQTNPAGAWLALHKAVENLNVAVGRSLVPIIIPGLNKLSSWLRDFAEWGEAHPIRMQYLVDGFIALAGAMAITGTVFALTAAFRALGLLLGPFGLAAGLSAIAQSLSIGTGVVSLGSLLVGVAGGIAAVAAAALLFSPDTAKSAIGAIEQKTGKTLDGAFKYMHDMDDPNWGVHGTPHRFGRDAVEGGQSASDPGMWESLKNEIHALGDRISEMKFVADGRVLGGIAARHAAREASRDLSSTALPDMRMTRPTPGYPGQ